MAAWEAAYGFLAAVLIEAEEALRAGNKRKRHGWAGWQEMRVLRKVCESQREGVRVCLSVGGVAGVSCHVLVRMGRRACKHAVVHAVVAFPPSSFLSHIPP